MARLKFLTAASLLLVVGIAARMQFIGRSMALGVFLAGVLLADSESRRARETDIEPFKGLLPGLFFIAVGMSIDFGVLMTFAGLMATSFTGLSSTETHRHVGFDPLHEAALSSVPSLHRAFGARTGTIDPAQTNRLARR